MTSKQFTWRSIAIGAVMAFLIASVFPYGVIVKGTSIGPTDFITSESLLLLFLLVVINTPARWVLPRFALSPHELVVIYVMMIAASAIPIIGVTAQLIPFLPGVYYFATPENQWDELIHPHINSWLVPQDELAIRYFFEGLPQGLSIPWNAWITPLLMWGSFMLSLYLMMIAIAALMHKRWQDERLVYPLVQLPLEMIAEDDSDSPVNRCLKNPVLWLGFAIPFLMLSLYGLHAHFPAIPSPELSTRIPLFYGMKGMGYAQDSVFVALRFLIIGLTYFVSLEISFSLWFFYLLFHLQAGLFTRIGFDVPGFQELHSEGTIASAHQGMGALIALVVISLWTARSHLWSAFRSAFSAQKVNDDEQMLSYRTCVWLLIAAAFYAVAWLNMAGVPIIVAIVLLGIAFSVFLGLTRVVAEGGIGYGRATMTPMGFTVHVFGTAQIGPQGLTTFAFSHGWAGDIRTAVMTSTANGLKLATETRTRQQPLFWVILIAVIVSLVGSAYTIIATAYAHGGINLNWWFYGYFCQWAYEQLTIKQLNPIPDWNILGPRGLFTGLGASLMALLMFLRHRFLSWPLHYIGVPIAGTYVMFFAWFSMFLGWLFKLIILKYGGSNLYVRLRPFFLGLVLGNIVCAGFWMAVTLITDVRTSIPL